MPAVSMASASAVSLEGSGAIRRVALAADVVCGVDRQVRAVWASALTPRRWFGKVPCLDVE